MSDVWVLKLKAKEFVDPEKEHRWMPNVMNSIRKQQHPAPKPRAKIAVTIGHAAPPHPIAH
jgi:hypothetical protein